MVQAKTHGNLHAVQPCLEIWKMKTCCVKLKDERKNL